MNPIENTKATHVTRANIWPNSRNGRSWAKSRGSTAPSVVMPAEPIDWARAKIAARDVKNRSGEGEGEAGGEGDAEPEVVWEGNVDETDERGCTALG